ncbi:MAG: sulfatase [Planctomycetes bacterium]|nr:sulfatase [Planctomycetota bacterium]
MNIVLIYSDTMRRDHIGAYGNDWIHTPNLDKLASESVVFDRAYTSSFPTVPNRHDLLTGRFTFTYFEWSPLPADAVSVGEVLKENGFLTMMIGDTPHIFKGGYNFQRGFSAWKWVRGQENDNAWTYPFEPEVASAQKTRRPASLRQHLRNVHRRYWEEEYFPAITMREAARWLEENRKAENFLLYVDTFDPHEPWDPPAHYREIYEKNPTGADIVYPKYDFADYLTDEEIKHIRASYAGEVTLVDTWVGYLLRRIEELGLAEDTAVIFTTDHGFCLGEHNFMGKSLIRGDQSCHIPLWDVISHIPLMIRVPGARPRRTDALVQTPDTTATIYDLAGVKAPPTVQGLSLVPVLENTRDEHRELAVSSSSLIHGVGARRFSTVTRGKWQLIYGGDKYEYAGAGASTVDSVRRTEKALYKPDEPGIELYDLAADPAGEKDVARENPQVVRDLHAKYVEFLKAIDTPPESIENRLRLPGF